MISSSSIKKLFIFTILLIISWTFYAEEINITWKWSSSDKGITHFRFQKDGEDEDKWQVVDATVNSYTAGPFDASIEHVLYLQQSFDGINWGPSYAGVYNPEKLNEYASAKDTFVDEDQAAVTESAVVGDEKPEKEDLNSEQSHSQNSKLPTNFRYGIELSFGLGDSYGFDKTNRYADLPGIVFPAVSLDFVLDNLVSYFNKFELGIISGLSFQVYSPQVSMVQFLDAHALVTWRYAFENNLLFRVGLGTTVLSPYANLSENTVSLFNPSDINIFYGLAGKLNLQYIIDNSFFLGLQIDGKMLFSDTFSPYEFTGLWGIVFGYVF
jgi:hypothetical protein